MDSTKKINIIMFGNIDSSKLGKKSNWLMLLKKIRSQLHYIKK